ncbi:MAG: HNH endonuclease [Candidatus Delongbacteria bacterium]|nr:HNH endonuclease [Candidatus Delongbacteria bacterium]MBN2834500.1 HNH endonuclease [Candidatus Delongbacteria bacterium]
MQNVFSKYSNKLLDLPLSKFLEDEEYSIFESNYSDILLELGYWSISKIEENIVDVVSNSKFVMTPILSFLELNRIVNILAYKTLKLDKRVFIITDNVNLHESFSQSLSKKSKIISVDHFSKNDDIINSDLLIISIEELNYTILRKIRNNDFFINCGLVFIDFNPDKLSKQKLMTLYRCLLYLKFRKNCEFELFITSRIDEIERFVRFLFSDIFIYERKIELKSNFLIFKPKLKNRNPDFCYQISDIVSQIEIKKNDLIVSNRDNVVEMIKSISSKDQFNKNSFISSVISNSEFYKFTDQRIDNLIILDMDYGNHFLNQIMISNDIKNIIQVVETGQISRRLEQNVNFIFKYTNNRKFVFDDFFLLKNRTLVEYETGKEALFLYDNYFGNNLKNSQFVHNLLPEYSNIRDKKLFKLFTDNGNKIKWKGDFIFNNTYLNYGSHIYFVSDLDYVNNTGRIKLVESGETKINSTYEIDVEEYENPFKKIRIDIRITSIHNDVDGIKNKVELPYPIIIKGKEKIGVIIEFENNGEINILDYGPNWKKIREEVLDGNLKCKICGNEDNLHIHHIKPLRSFQSIDEANKKENLIALCPSCHKNAEKECITRDGFDGFKYSYERFSAIKIFRLEKENSKLLFASDYIFDINKMQSAIEYAIETIETCKCLCGCNECTGFSDDYMEIKKNSLSLGRKVLNELKKLSRK